ncbi:nickel-dependent lactate racemase [Alicyclobacillus tolerans]|uniref:lactate racemase domain-containing protein n=1 Tax=Alicyclobacillus tolerans TaxID=90970 RepID=UPI001F1DE068|nr:lactate racemase domain-containing protein [Alicyclobacillus tolerans]MCF8567355.1 nickel-dependent lactate racemase [Alicyclobacillus tolerans]
MSVIDDLLKTVSLPKMTTIRQHFQSSKVVDIDLAVNAAFSEENGKLNWPSGKNVAVVVGSRGIADIHEITKITVSVLRAKGYDPFVIPGMGSHGGATADGQKEVLASLGVTEEFIGAPIRSSMDVVQIGELPNGLPIYVDKLAYAADGIVLINRIKPHTAFRGKYESGIVKMIAIGLGKQKGAESYHKLGFGHMEEHIVRVANEILSRHKIVCGVAVIENAYDQVTKIEVLPADEILEREPALLEFAKQSMPRILADDIDVLVVDEIGKNISGDGMDPNITGRYGTEFAIGGPNVTRIAVLRLTEKTHGNANGLGVADTTTKRCFKEVDFEKTYPNALTSTVVSLVRAPMILENDLRAIQAAIKTANVLYDDQVRVVHIRTTLSLDVIRVSESLLPVVVNRPDVEVLSQPSPWPFGESGELDFAGCWSSE